MRVSKYCIIVLLIFISVGLISCQSKNENDIQQLAVDEIEERIIEPITDNPISSEFKTKISDFAVDIDLDNIKETIELYTAAERDEGGNMIWDDGQKWLLVVKDGDMFYPLLSEYVQLGQVYFTMYLQGEDRIPTINVMVSTGAGLKLSKYVFDNDKHGFREEPVYEEKDINFMFTSIPNY